MKKVVIFIMTVLVMAVCFGWSSVVAFTLVTLGVACLVKLCRMLKSLVTNIASLSLFNLGVSYVTNINLISVSMLSIEKKDADRIFKDATDGLVEYVSLINRITSKIPNSFTKGFKDLLVQMDDALELYETSEIERDKLFEHDKILFHSINKVDVIAFRQGICLDRIAFINSTNTKELITHKKKIAEDLLYAIKNFYDKLEELR